MAGAGYKLFNTGDVLLASEVNTYLMQQTVMSFADSAARTTALSGVLAEGMVSYLRDTNVVEIYNGSAWASLDDPNAIQNTIVDAKGDLITATAADTPARLAVGSNGDTLVADSSATTGLRYTPTGLSNPIINGGMDIWQRGTSFTVGNTVYLMDRWYNTGDTNLTVTRDTDVPTNPYFNYSAKLVGTGTQSISQKIESANSARLAGQVVTISLYAKKTSGTGALNINIYYPSATDNFASITQIGSALQMSSNPGSSWTRYSVTTAALPADVQKGFVVLIDNVNTHTIFVTGVQIDVGSVALPFRRAGGTIQGELAACQRYYYRNTDSSGVAYQGVGQAMSTTVVDTAYFLPVTMRTNPSTLETSNMAVYASGATRSGGTFTLLYANQNTPTIRYTHGSAVFTNGSAAWLVGNSANCYVGLSAEL
jgi:hypothetical protein